MCVYVLILQRSPDVTNLVIENIHVLSISRSLAYHRNSSYNGRPDAVTYFTCNFMRTRSKARRLCSLIIYKLSCHADYTQLNCKLQTVTAGTSTNVLLSGNRSMNRYRIPFLGEKSIATPAFSNSIIPIISIIVTNIRLIRRRVILFENKKFFYLLWFSQPVRCATRYPTSVSFLRNSWNFIG